MHSRSESADLQARISSPEWRSKLLSQLNSLKDFATLVDRSREPGLGGRPELVPAMADEAREILRHYPLDELRAARLHYNAQHLLAFWKHHHGIIRTGMAKGMVSKRFPLLAVDLDTQRRQISIEGVRIEQITGGLFRRTNTQYPPTYARFDFDPGDRQATSTLSARELLESLQGRLTWIVRRVKDSGSILYTQFLANERRTGSELWDWYRIHVFLDNFLYHADATAAGLSRFEFVFFASNYHEFMTWLEMHLPHPETLSLNRISAFLKRQTKFNLGLSQRISLAENELRNRSRELLAYNEPEGIVKLASIPDNLLADTQRYFNELGISSQGCPFGRIKGNSKNALVEIYEYFDQLYLRVIEASWEFRLLTKPRHGSGGTI